MHRTYERNTKVRLSFSGGPHALANMADSMEEVNVSGEKHKKWHCICCAALRCTALYFVAQVFANP